MSKFHYIFIGGGVASTKAAETARKIDQTDSMAIISEEPESLYSRINLPYFLKDIIPLERLYLHDDRWYEDNHIQLLKGKKAVKVETNPRRITLDDGEKLEYEKLLIATGGKVNLWPPAHSLRLGEPQGSERASRPGGEVPGANLEGVFYLRTIEDAKKIREWIKETKHGVIVGAGFIGLEFSTTFGKHGITADFLVRGNYYWEPMLDRDQGELLSQMLKERGIQVWLNEEGVELLGNPKVHAVKTKKGQEIECQMVGVGIGIHTDLSFLSGSGIKTNKGIITNEYFETNVPGVYAAGDVAEFYDVIFARQHQLGNWANAQVQGQIAGQNIAGQKNVYETVSAYSIQVFDGNVSFVGALKASDKTKVIKRGTLQDRSIGKILVEEGRIIGATLVNRARETTQIASLIRSKVNISGREAQLTDPSFDLATLS